jgi:hypothetical protein
MLFTAVPFSVVGATWRLPDTYHSAGSGRGTATLKFYEVRDILAACEDVFSGLPLVACPRTMEGWGVTSQISDEVRFHGVWYAITAVDGAGLFDPAEHGLKPGPLSTACWRGFICRYHIDQGQITLEDVEMGRPTSDHIALPLFGVPAGPTDDRSEHAGALR